MLFSVIIPTFQRNDLLSICLERLQSSIQTLPSDYYEVIITDDGRDITAKELIETKYPWAKWVEGPRSGPAANRNNGAAYAQGTWLVFTDDDCVPSDVLLQNYKNAIESNPSNQAFEGAILPERIFNPDLEECPVNLSGNYFWSANVCVKKEIFLKMKGFDTHYPAAELEDQDFYIRLQEQTKVLFLPNCKVTHPIRNIELLKKIKKIPLSAKTWAYHATKHKQHFNYKNNIDIICQSIKFFVKDTIKTVIARKPNTFFLRVSYFFVGIPVLIFHLLNKPNVPTKIN